MSEQGRFKAGDKVRVKYLYLFKSAKFVNPSGKMNRYAGKIVTIHTAFTEQGYEDCYTIHEDGGKWFWYDDMFSEKIK